MFGPFVYFAPKDSKSIWLPNIFALSVLDEGYSRNASYELNKMSTCLLLQQYKLKLTIDEQIW